MVSIKKEDKLKLKKKEKRKSEKKYISVYNETKIRELYPLLTMTELTFINKEYKQLIFKNMYLC